MTGEGVDKSIDRQHKLSKVTRRFHSVKDFKISGKSTKRLDAREKVTGKAKYAGDIKHPGMLYARIARPPMHGAKLKSMDTSKAKAMNACI